MNFDLIMKAVQVFALVCAAVGSVVGVLIALHNARTSLAIAQRGAQNAAAIQELHITVDGRLSELLEVSKALAHAQGVVEGQNGSAVDPAATALAAATLLETAAVAKRALDNLEPKK